MLKHPHLPPFGKIFLTGVVLFAVGGASLGYLVFYMEPHLGPRWLLYFFLTIAASGFALPITYFLQRRTAKSPVPANVLVREAIFFAVFLDLVLWMQIGRIASNLIIFLLAVGLILLEFLLRLAEKATFNSTDTEI